MYLNYKKSSFLATKVFSTSFAIILWESSSSLLKLSCDILNFLNRSIEYLIDKMKQIKARSLIPYTNLNLRSLIRVYYWIIFSWCGPRLKCVGGDRRSTALERNKKGLKWTFHLSEDLPIIQVYSRHDPPLVPRNIETACT